MTVFHRKPSLRAQFLEEKTQNLQLVSGPKSTLEIVESCTNFELQEFFHSPQNVHLKALLYFVKKILEILSFLTNEEYLDETDFDIHQIQKFDVFYNNTRTKIIAEEGITSLYTVSWGKKYLNLNLINTEEYNFKIFTSKNL